MGLLAWVMMGLAIWHFTVFVPDKFWGGIVGAFLGALFGAVIFGLLVHGLTVPNADEMTIVTAIEAAPGALLGMAAVYFEGMRRERAEQPEPA
ncbi:MAG: hypothetical protein QOD55_2943 [Solirubrobacteraceae bacterium]|jgi:thiol:disulfide interchange protein|nr:hypothetical protein [Solirubrobacteraceae bacterium]